MFEVIKREMIVPNMHMMTVSAKDITEKIEPGHFIIVRSHKDGERIPLSVADWDREKGELTFIFMEVGASTGRLSSLGEGDMVNNIVGPLGRKTEIAEFGTVVCVGGCFGIGSIYPVIRALKKKNNKVITIIEARSKNLLYWQDKLAKESDMFFPITRDGSFGYKGHIKRGAELLMENGIKPDRIIGNGCTFMIYKVSKDLEFFNVPVMVSLNTIMIDGTGMCGVCRVTVDGTMKFACVDGPDFDGRLVDWEELSKRRKQYIDEEAFLVHNSGCGGS